MIRIVLSTLLAVCLCGFAKADIVLAPQATIRNDLGTWSNPGHDIDLAYDQSGLSNNYVSGITDLNGYLTLNPTHVSRYGVDPKTTFVSNGGTPFGFIDFDLGDSYSLNSFVFWQGWHPNEQVRDFTLFTSETSDFSVATNVGSFIATFNPNTTNGGIAAFEQFDVTDSVGRYVRLHIQSNTGSAGFSHFGELAFGASAIPEASSFLCFSLLSAGTILWRCRRKLHDI